MSLLIKLGVKTSNPSAIQIPATDIFQLVGPENDAYDHWQLKGSADSLVGLVNQRELIQSVEAGTSISYTETNLVTSMGQGVSAGWHEGLRYRDFDGYAICFTYKRPSVGESLVYGIGGSTKSNSNKLLSLANQVRALGPGIGDTYQTATDEQWVFVCITQDNVNNLTTLFTATKGSTESFTGTGTDSDNELISLGGYLDGSSSATPVNLEYAECIMYNKYLSESNIRDIYARSIERMKAQGVDL